MQDRTKSVRQALFIFGAFVFGELAESLLHEGGHALALTLIGGKVERISINPLGWSYTYQATVPKYPVFTTFGGIGFGSLARLVLLWLAWRFHDPYWVPLGMSGILALVADGLYYLFGTVFGAGDPASLVGDGVPAALVLAIGIIALLLGLLLMLYFLPLTGLRPEAPFLQNFIILGSGISLYLVLMIVHNVAADPKNMMFWGLIAAAGFLLVAIVTAGCRAVHSRIPARYALPPADIQWSHTVFALCLGLLPAIVALLAPG